MGPVDWFAVISATVAAFALGGAWYGPLFGRAKLAGVGPGGLAARSTPLKTMGITAALLFVSAAMMGHMFARVGTDTLAVKPWLYFMISGGIALMFVIPALLISYTHQKISTAVAMIDAGYWLSAYLAMGSAFWLLG
ncbi:MAG TPA: DUF1761 domain-containing protein [Novosphingobium sp.]|nr:DUF1761 domain-containing protein [Novosphingobium sp.]